VVPGVDYAMIQTTNWNNGEPWSIHVARVDRSRKDLAIRETLAGGQIFGVAPVSTIAKEFPRHDGEPIVMVNAGFCIRTRHPYQGAPRGLVVVDRELVSSSGICPRDYVFSVDENGAMQFGKFAPRFRATLPDGSAVPLGINNLCDSNSAVLYTHILGKSTRATNTLEVVLESPGNEPLTWRLGNSYDLVVARVNPSGNSPLSNKVAVLSFGSAMEEGKKLAPGDRIKIDLRTSPELKNIVTASHTIFPLVEKGKKLEKFDADGVILRKNPRTAIGFNEKHFYLVVVDGRKKELSMGMDAHELAEFMQLLGCVEAANLDGGGSSTFWLNGQTRNTVVGSRERDRGDALVVVKKPEAVARQ
jgi:hypothetical protein